MVLEGKKHIFKFLVFNQKSEPILPIILFKGVCQPIYLLNLLYKFQKYFSKTPCFNTESN